MELRLEQVRNLEYKACDAKESLLGYMSRLSFTLAVLGEERLLNLIDFAHIDLELLVHHLDAPGDIVHQLLLILVIHCQ